MKNLDHSQEDHLDDLDVFEKDYFFNFFKSLIIFLPQSYLEELKNSIDEVIY
tara:strand:+ start:113 stop:268 length:156 start_codon:yes stop_codon:yes gene_type:complete